MSTKVIAFSLPESLEKKLVKQAKSEHRTISEFLREAVRRYLALNEFDSTQKAVSKRLKKKGLTSADVEDVLDEMRRP